MEVHQDIKNELDEKIRLRNAYKKNLDCDLKKLKDLEKEITTADVRKFYRDVDDIGEVIEHKHPLLYANQRYHGVDYIDTKFNFIKVTKGMIESKPKGKNGKKSTVGVVSVPPTWL